MPTPYRVSPANRHLLKQLLAKRMVDARGLPGGGSGALNALEASQPGLMQAIQAANPQAAAEAPKYIEPALVDWGRMAPNDPTTYIDTLSHKLSADPALADKIRQQLQQQLSPEKYEQLRRNRIALLSQGGQYPV